jgi:hypothetical protein
VPEVAGGEAGGSSALTATGDRERVTARRAVAHSRLALSAAILANWEGVSTGGELTETRQAEQFQKENGQFFL